MCGTSLTGLCLSLYVSAAGTAVRFEPGECKTVSLVDIAGDRIVRGGNGICDGPISDSTEVQRAVRDRLVAGGFRDSGSAPETDGSCGSPSKRPRVEAAPIACCYEGLEVPRSLYARMYGPTVGDVVRLADTELYVRVEADRTVYGDECKFGGGKTIREGMGQATGLSAAQQVDTVITNALVLDHTGIYKADIGIKDGLICGIGKAGNPDVMAGVSPALIVGVNSEVIAGEGLIVTAGGFDAHVHFICPQICEEALASGLTTMLGGGTGGPAADAQPRAHEDDAAGQRHHPHELRVHGQGQHVFAGGAAGDHRGRRRGAEAARGLGHHSGCDRRVSVGGGRGGRAGHDPHRHPQREQLRGADHGRHQR